MGIQETVLELFQEQRIDKAVAYRLLADCKKGAATRPDDIRLSCRLERAPETPPADATAHELHALSSWVYLLHIVTGKDELEIDHVQSDQTLRLKVHVDDQLTPTQLMHSIAAGLAAGAHADDEAAAWAWVAAGASDAQRRKIAASRLPDTGGDAAGAIVLELRAQPEAQGATLAADWPETLQHFHEVMWRAPATRFAELDRLPPRHKHLIAAYNATNAYLPPARTLPGLLDPVLDL